MQIINTRDEHRSTAGLTTLNLPEALSSVSMPESHRR